MPSSRPETWVKVPLTQRVLNRLTPRRACRKHGHIWLHRPSPQALCNATRSTCERCGFATWRYWDYR